MIVALIPAAGRSTRMGRPKLMLPLGKRNVIEQVLLTLQLVGIDKILVVTPPELPELATVARAAGAEVLQLPSPTEHMRETVEQGLAWIKQHWSPQPSDAFLLVPADHPTLDMGVVAVLLVARVQHPTWSIFIPTHEGKRGHPALIGWKHVPGIRNAPADEGLNIYLRQHSAETLEVTVDRPSVLRDIDTPEDYERLRVQFDQE